MFDSGLQYMKLAIILGILKSKVVVNVVSIFLSLVKLNVCL